MVRTAYRLALAAATLALTSVAVFAVFGATPGRPTDALQLEQPLSPSTRRALDPEAGTTWLVRYEAWMIGASRLDFGESKSYGRPVAALVAERAVFTLWLAVPSVVAAWAFALPLGVWSAYRAGHRFDRTLLATTSALLAVPEVVAAFLVLWVAVRLRVSAPLGSSDVVGGSVATLWPALALPLTLVVLTSVPAVLRNVRLSALVVLDEPWVRTVSARGVAVPRLLARHVARAAASPLVTLFGGSLTAACGGALVAEVTFGWPGLGALLLHAGQARDEPLVAGIVMFVAAMVVLVNVMVELLADLVDPRTRSL